LEWYSCYDCRCAWRKINYGKYEICTGFPIVGLENRYCPGCLKKVGEKDRQILEKLWKREGKRRFVCPRCGNRGEWDSQGYDTASSDRSVWWNFKLRRFECIECFLTDDSEPKTGAA